MLENSIGLTEAEIKGEIWMPIKDYEDYYEVSNLGRVKFLERVVRTGRGGIGRRTIPESILKTWAHTKGYLMVCLKVSNVGYNKLIHRLVLEAFVGPCPLGMEACHNDGNTRNSRLSNLRWDTHSENMLDSVRHGTKNAPKWEKHHASKLTIEQVKQIRKLYKTGNYSIRGLGRMFGITGVNAGIIVRNQGWVGV